MKKIFLNILIVLFLFIFIHKPVTSQELIPQPGINCGVGTEQKNVDLTNPENFQYRCCYSLIEKGLDLNVSDIPVVGSVFDGIFDFIVKRIEDFPFVFWPFSEKPPFSIGMVIDATKSFFEEKRCEPGSKMVVESGNCFCQKEESFILESLAPFCNIINDVNEQQNCFECIGYEYDSLNKKFKKKEKGKGGVYTGIGCIPGDLGVFIKEKVFGWGVGLAGIIALFCIIYAAFQIQTSQGSPEKIKKGQELLTSCIMGLMLIIFSVFILKLIGVDILRIPSFR